MTDKAKLREAALKMKDESEFIREAEPVWGQLYEICKKHGVSALFSAAVKNTTTERSMAGFSHLIGPEKTPDVMSVAYAFLFGGREEGIGATTAMMLSGLLGDGPMGETLTARCHDDAEEAGTRH